MFSTISARISKTATTALVVTALGFGLFAGATSAHAKPIIIGDGTPCAVGNGETVPEGTTATDENGVTWVCFKGKWEPAPQALTGPAIKRNASRVTGGVLTAR
jgi:hypothetical protein